MGITTLITLGLLSYVSAFPQDPSQIGADDFQTRYNLLRENVENSLELVFNQFNQEAEIQNELFNQADWKYKQYATPDTLDEKITRAIEFSDFYRKSNEQAKAFESVASNIPDERLQRMIELYKRPKTINLPEKELYRIHELSEEMKEEFDSATVCKNLNCNRRFSPDIETEFRKNRNYEELKQMSLAWDRNLGKTMRARFMEFVDLANRGAQQEGYKDYGQRLRVPFESSNLKGEAAKLKEEIQPLYEQLHAYVRGRLLKYYGESNIEPKGALPQHVFGDINAEDWSNIYDIVEPYPNQESLDVSDHMEKQQYTTEKVYRLANDYFKAMNLKPVPESFFRNSMFERHSRSICTPDTSEQLHQLNQPEHLRLIDCNRPSHARFVAALEQMGKIQYAMQFKDQPAIFRDAPNPAFAEAVGKALALSATTPAQLKSHNLMENPEMNEEQQINFLMMQALRTIPNMQYRYLVENYRWDLFEGKTDYQNMQCDWVQKRYDIQGIKPIKTRTESDFDAGSHYAVFGPEDSMREFLSEPIKFQMFKAICEAKKGSGREPLHLCPVAGEKLAKMMSSGASKDGRTTLRELTGTDSEISSEALREYFQPLEQWLTKYNADNNQHVGWDKVNEKYQLCLKADELPTLRTNIGCTTVRTRSGVECL